MVVRTIKLKKMDAAKRFPFDYKAYGASISQMKTDAFKLDGGDLDRVRRLRFPGSDPRTVADAETVRSAHRATVELEVEMEDPGDASRKTRGTVWRRCKDYPSIYVCFLYERMAMVGISKPKRKLLEGLKTTDNSFAAYAVFENAKAAVTAEAEVLFNGGTMRELLPVADEQPLYVMKHNGQAKLEHCQPEPLPYSPRLLAKVRAQGSPSSSDGSGSPKNLQDLLDDAQNSPSFQRLVTGIMQ